MQSGTRKNISNQRSSPAAEPRPVLDYFHEPPMKRSVLDYFRAPPAERRPVDLISAAGACGLLASVHAALAAALWAAGWLGGKSALASLVAVGFGLAGLFIALTARQIGQRPRKRLFVATILINLIPTGVGVATLVAVALPY